jgi:hypothetical protein
MRSFLRSLAENHSSTAGQPNQPEHNPLRPRYFDFLVELSSNPQFEMLPEIN